MQTTDRAVRAEIQIGVRALAVTRALTEFERLKEWWGVDRVLIDERADGPWTLTWLPTDAEPARGVLCGTIRSLRHSSHLHVQRLVFISPDRPILGPFSLTFEARERGTSTQLSVVQEGFGAGDDWDWYRSLVADSWPRDLEALRTCLEPRA